MKSIYIKMLLFFKKNSNKKKYFFIFTFLTLVVNNILLIILIIPDYYLNLKKANVFSVFKNYDSVLQLNNYPFNQCGLLTNDLNKNSYNNFSELDKPISIHRTNENKQYFARGFQSYAQDNNLIKSYPLSNTNNIYSDQNSINLWQNLLKYYLNSGNYPMFKLKNLDSSFPIQAVDSLIYQFATTLSSSVFISLYDLNQKYKSLFNEYTSIIGLMMGLKYKYINSKQIFYGGSNGNLQIKNFSDAVQSGIAQQLPYNLKNQFEKNKFFLRNSNIPINSDEIKFTYLIGNILNNKNNLELWGIPNNANINFIKNNESVFNNETAINNIKMLKNNILFSNKNNFNTVIPCLVNNAFVKKYNLHKNQEFTYHVKIPSILYHKANDINANGKSIYTIANSNNYYFGADFSLGGETAGTVYYSGNNSNTLNSNTFNSVSYLNNVTRYEKLNNNIFSNTKNNNMIFTNDLAMNNISTNNKLINSTYKFKIVNVYNNNYYKPLFFTNYLMANYLNGYTSNWNNNFQLGDVDTKAFNAILGKKNDFDFLKYTALLFSTFSDYSAVGQNGTNLKYDFEKKEYSKQSGTVVSGKRMGIGNISISSDEKTNVSNMIFDKENEMPIYNFFSQSFIDNSLTNITNLLNPILITLIICLLVLTVIIFFALFNLVIFLNLKEYVLYNVFGYKQSIIVKKLLSPFFIIWITCFLVSILTSYIFSIIVEKILNNLLYKLPFIWIWSTPYYIIPAIIILSAIMIVIFWLCSIYLKRLKIKYVFN